MSNSNISRNSPSISNQIRDAVNNMRNTNNLSNQTPLDRSLRCFSAVAAVRKNIMEDKDISTLDRGKLTDFSTAFSIVAQQKGIKSNNGSFSQDQINNEKLSIEELYKIYAEKIFKESGEKPVEAQKHLDKELESYYPKKQDSSSSVPPEMQIKYMSYKSDDEFKNLSDDDKKNYLGQPFLSNYERSRLQDILKNNESGEEDKHTGQFGQDGKPVDDFDDFEQEDFKIEQGDIIEYLMKDIILASAAWVGNKVAGFTGVVAYNLTKDLFHAVEPPIQKVWSKSKERASKGFNKFLDKLLGEENADDKLNKQKRELFTDLAATLETNKKTRQRNAEMYGKLDDNSSASLNNLLLLIGRHNIVLQDKGILLPNIQQNQLTFNHDPVSFKNSFRLEKESDGVKYVEQLRQNFDEFQIDSMIETLGVTTEEDKEKVKSFYTKFMSVRDEQNQNGAQNHTKFYYSYDPNDFTAFIPAGKNYNKMRKALNKAAKELKINIAFNPEKRAFEKARDDFSESYAFLAYQELLRTDPDNPILSDRDQRDNFFNQQVELGKGIFLKAEQARLRDNSTPPKIPSREKLQNMVNKLIKESHKHAVNKDLDSYGNPVKLEHKIDNISDIYITNDQAGHTEAQNLIESAKASISTEVFLRAEIKNCNTEINSLGNLRILKLKERQKIINIREGIIQKAKNLKLADDKGNILNNNKYHIRGTSQLTNGNG